MDGVMIIRVAQKYGLSTTCSGGQQKGEPR